MMFTQEKTLLTGSGGVLGGELMKLLPLLLAPSKQEFDVTDYAGMEAYVLGRDLNCVFHAAAFTSPPLVDKDPERALDVNIVGTANVVRLCARHGLRLVYVSTDYVFRGDAGNYAEEDPVHPVNKYAWSKLGGECAVRLLDDFLLIRTTFGPNKFPYPKAFVDQWTSRESVTAIASMIAVAIQSDVRGVLHVGGPRKTVFEYAKGLDAAQEIEELRVAEVGFSVPRYTSLDVSRYEELLPRT